MRTDEEILIGIQATLQSLLHQIEELSRTSIFKQNLKQRTENYYSYIDIITSRFVFELDKEYKDKEEQNQVRVVRDQCVSLVAQIDAIVSQITIE
jgi:hypothetical protein